MIRYDTIWYDTNVIVNSLWGLFRDNDKDILQKKYYKIQIAWYSAQSYDTIKQNKHYLVHRYK